MISRVIAASFSFSLVLKSRRNMFMLIFETGKFRWYCRSRLLQVVLYIQNIVCTGIDALGSIGGCLRLLAPTISLEQYLSMLSHLRRGQSRRIARTVGVVSSLRYVVLGSRGASMRRQGAIKIRLCLLLDQKRGQALNKKTNLKPMYNYCLTIAGLLRNLRQTTWMGTKPNGRVRSL